MRNICKYKQRWMELSQKFTKERDTTIVSGLRLVVKIDNVSRRFAAAVRGMGQRYPFVRIQGPVMPRETLRGEIEAALKIHVVI